MSSYATHNSTKTFRAVGKQGLWAIRQLMHELRGQQVSFWLPTFSADFTAAADITSNTRTMTVAEVGYAEYVQGRPSRGMIRIQTEGGTTYYNQIVGSVDNGNGTETLHFADMWSSSVSRSTITRIDYMEKVRFDADDITIDYLPGGLVHHISGPVRTVLE